MENTQQVTFELDMDNELVADWFARMLESTRHPMYQNGVRLVKSRTSTEG